MLVLVIGDFHIPHRAIDLPAKFKSMLLPGKIQQILCTGNLLSKQTLDYLRTIASDVVCVKGDMDEIVVPYTNGNAGSVATGQPPHSRVIQYGPIRVGLLHGHQVIPWGSRKALGIAARQLNVDVLVSGHTHVLETFEQDGCFFINPGSATGAFTLVNSVGAGLVGAPPKQPAVSLKDEQTLAKQQLMGETVELVETKEPEVTDSATVAQPETPQPLVERASFVGTTPSFVLLDIQGDSMVIYIYKFINSEVKVEKMEFKKPISIST